MPEGNVVYIQSTIPTADQSKIGQPWSDTSTSPPIHKKCTQVTPSVVYASTEGGAGANHNILSATHLDTLAAAVVAGDLARGNATPAWARLPIGTTDQVLTVVAGLPAWAAAAGGAGGIRTNAGRPAAPTEGQEWWDTQLSAFFIRELGRDKLYIPFANRVWLTQNSRTAGTAGQSTMGGILSGVGTFTHLAADGGAAGQYSTGAVAGNDAGFSTQPSNDAVFQRDESPIIAVRFRISRITDVRFFVGLSNGTIATMVGADDPAGHYAGIQFSTVRGDTEWQVVTKDNVTQSRVSYGASPAVDTSFHTLFMRIDNVNGRVVFALDEVAQIIRTTNLPGAGVNIGPILGVETQIATDMNMQYRYFLAAARG